MLTKKQKRINIVLVVVMIIMSLFESMRKSL